MFILRKFLLVILLGILLVPGCSSSNSSTKPKLSPPEDTARFIDWNQLDWKFQRYTFASAYLFEQMHQRSSFSIFQDATKYDGPVKALSFSEFQALPGSSRSSRRNVAAIHINEAMAFHRIMLRSWEIWLYSRNAAVAQEAFRYKDGLISHTLKHLETAAGLDPSNPYTWYNLEYFSGLVGNRHRQLESLNSGFAALKEFQDKGPSTELLYLRMLLDKSWLLRAQGDFALGLQTVAEAILQIARDDQRTLDLAKEALLLRALLAVDLGDIHKGRSLAANLASWKLPLQSKPSQSANFSSTALNKNNHQHIESNFCRQWVWAMTYLKQGNSEKALAYINKQKWVTEFPAHLNFRFWQDMGRIQESFGQWDEAKTSYGFAILYRPFFPFYPMEGARGLSRIFGNTSTGQTYYLGYGSMFLAGSYFSFAANRVIAMEASTNPADKNRHGQDAIDALTACIKHDMRLPSAFGLRGRVHYRLNNFPEAESDLHKAHDLLISQGRDNSDVVLLLAILHFDRKDFPGSLDFLSRYQELKPNDGFGWRLSGLALAHSGRFHEALDAQNQALVLAPRAASGWYNRALVHLKLGEVELARSDLEQARKLSPRNEEIQKVRMLIRANPQTKINITNSSVVLGVSRQDSLLFANSGRSSSANLVENISNSDLQTMLKKLREDHEENPAFEQRLLLGRILIQAGLAEEVQELLSPLWPSQLSYEELELLLRADRSSGFPDRAIRLSRSLETNPDPVQYSDFWALVGIICIENDAFDDGNRALDMALVLNPENAALMQMRFGSNAGVE